MPIPIGGMQLWRIACLRSSLPLKRSTTLASSNASTQASPPNPRFTVEYLVQSCGLSSDEALRASQRIPGLKSLEKADAVLGSLRETGIRESDIRTAVSREPRILFSHVEKNIKPNMAKLQELGFSIEDISGIISSSPNLFRFNFVSKIDYWMGVLGSVENLSLVLKLFGGVLISNSLEKVIMPNISFLRDQCGLSSRHIIRLIKSNPKLVSSNPERVKRTAERAEELGIARSSSTFVDALISIGCQKQTTIDARLNNLRSTGLSEEEIKLMIRNAPLLLNRSEESVRNKMEFLLKEAGCDKLHVIQNPFLFNCSLENRLIPRNLVRKLLMLKEIPVANLLFGSFAKPSDEKFVDKFVLPYEHVIPGLHQAFADAGNIDGLNQLIKSISI